MLNTGPPAVKGGEEFFGKCPRHRNPLEAIAAVGTGQTVETDATATNTKGKAVKGSKILVLGLAYKKDVDDVRESPSITIIELLRKQGAKVDYNDPHIPRTHKQREHDLKMKSVPLSARTLGRYDCVLISTDHSCYDYKWIVTHAKLVVDTRNATAKGRTG
ncbi:hypothetical protein LCGC14_1299780, partial [marine sediment metagenome]